MIMRKRFFGIRIRDVLMALGCLAAAVLFWLFVKYMGADAEATVALGTLGGII